MKNPLRKRVWRELVQDKGKYIALFLFLTIMIGFISGFLVADGSMKTAYDRAFEKYNVEDGHFVLAMEADDSLIKKLEEKDIKIYELFYKNKELDNGNSIRVYKNRNDIDRVSVIEGKVPTEDNEIAIDRLYAENNELAVGDSIKIDDKSYKISGLVALSDYTALFKNNTDTMLNANSFTVAVVTDKAFEDMSDGGLKYCYAWDNNKNLSDKEKNDLTEDITDILVKNTIITDMVQQLDNQAIIFAGDDMGSDKSMITWMLYIVIVILAFVFAITIKSTIEKESATIGTLRASGYTKWELVRHYLTLPLFVSLVAAIIGNICGYTFMKEVIVKLYYHSYSLPTYETIWNTEAFVLTTVIPCIIILIVNLIVLSSTLSLPPLQFLRHELKRKKKNKATKLPNFKFLTRFRIRIIIQNIPAYVTMFIGIFLASIMLMFGMIMTPILDNFKTEVLDSKFADYQYILKAPVETKNKNAEKYCVTALKMGDSEDISIYGISDNSKYLTNLDLPKNEDEVIVSNGYMEKFLLKVGDTITLSEKFEGTEHKFKIAGSFDYTASLAVFMTKDNFIKEFDLDKDYFTGYLSNEKIDDIDDVYIASTITEKDLTVLADQLNDSAGAMLPMFGAFAVTLYILLIYLLAKMIIEKNAQSISMIKILGYSNSEASKLYNRSTALVVILSLIISLPICSLTMKGIFFMFMQEMNGWLTFYIAPWIYPAMLGIGIACYAVVHMIQMRKIKKIPMSQALKNVE